MFDLFDKYQVLIRKIIRQKIGTDNPDLEQEIYIKLWQKQKDNKYIECGKEKNWVCVLTNNMCLDFFKTKSFIQAKKNVELSEHLITDGSNPEIIFSDTERQKIILAAIDSLPHKLRKVIILQEFEMLPLEQIAKKLNIPVGTVKSRIFNARKMLSNRLYFLKTK